MNANLEEIIMQHTGKHTISEDISEFPKVGLAFRGQLQDDDSENTSTSFDSYLSACSSIYTVENDMFDEPPQTQQRVQQAWAHPDVAVPTCLNMTPTTMSSVTNNDEINRITQEHEKG